VSITRVNEFYANPADIQELKELLVSIRTRVVSCSGCEEFRVLESDTDPSHFVIIETWDRIQSHQAAVEAIPKEWIERAMAMLSATPDGHYYEELGE
jgi:quinol monooxygenase YgiN